MEDLRDLLHLIEAHPTAAWVLVACVALYVLAAYVNGLLPVTSKAKPVLGWLLAAVDLLVFRKMRGAAGGRWSLPLVQVSKPPADTPVAVETPPGESRR